MGLSPLNIINAYVQLKAIQLKLGGRLHHRIGCYVGQTTTNIFITILGVLNLDFFHVVFPPLCVSTSFKAINNLLFDYVIAIYPLFFTVFIYLCIEFYDRNNRLTVLLSFPFRKCLFFHTTWDPKKTILKIFATFFLLSYSKLLFVSISLLLAAPSHNSEGKIVSNVLVFDPSIRFFHSEHIPYVVLALFVTLIFVLLPPLLLLLYPTRLGKTCLRLVRFRRWDILHLVMDIFQGWYKDGTEGTKDYRCLSALYLLYRMVMCYRYVVMTIKDYQYNHLRKEWEVLGILHILLGMLFLIAKPYRKTWMCHVDGLIFITFGGLWLTAIIYNKSTFILEVVTGFSVIVLTGLYAIYSLSLIHI